MPKQPTFRRLIVGVQPRPPDPAMRAAAELARRLNLDLLGLFVEDKSLIGLAALPFAREIRPFGGTWHAIAVDELMQEAAQAAQRAERQFNDLVRGLPTPTRFEVRQGSPADSIHAVSMAGDVIAIIEPDNPGERFSHQFASVCAAALRSAAAVLILPATVARDRGPVVALAGDHDDPAIAMARGLAQAFAEETVVLPLSAATPMCAPPSATSRMGEQLIVVTRGSLADETLSQLAARRRVPVLVIEREGEATSANPAARS